MVGEYAGPQGVVGGDLRELRPGGSMDLDRVRLEAPLDRAPACWHPARNRLREVLGGHPADGLVEDDLHPAVLDDAGDLELGASGYLRDQTVFIGVCRSDVECCCGVPSTGDLGQLG